MSREKSDIGTKKESSRTVRKRENSTDRVPPRDGKTKAVGSTRTVPVRNRGETKASSSRNALSSRTNIGSSRESISSRLKVKPEPSTSKPTTSSRVTKEKYFPKKYPFSSHLYEEKSKENVRKETKNETKSTDGAKTNSPKLVRQRTMTRTLSPSEVKILKDVATSKTEKERPRTATLRKHSPEPKPAPEPEPEPEVDDYEDDFESYESDFEEYKSSAGTPTDIDTDTSTTDSDENLDEKRINSAETDEERKLDSGTYDLPELKHKQVLDKIKEAIEKENLEINRKYSNEQPSNLASLSDEGFDERFNGNGLINFAETKKKPAKPSKRKKRGDDLMNMIRLNAVNYNLYDVKAISYDDFMHSYGRNGTVQVSSQTGDDNVSEEVQTETIVYKNKWTQYPVRSLTNARQYITYNHHGVGDDPPVQSQSEVSQIDDSKLDRFVRRSANLILALLEKKRPNVSQQSLKTEKAIPFSDGYFKLGIESCPFLSGRPVVCISFSDTSLLTVHRSNTEVYMNVDEQLLSRSTICVWNPCVPDSSRPRKILVSSGEIVEACFDNKYGYLVFAGVKDGGINVWDLREPSRVHRSVYEEKLDEWFVMRCPTYTTTAIHGVDSEIVAIQPLGSASLEICTLDESGVIRMWSVIERQNSNTVFDDQGLVPWGTVVLAPGITMSLQSFNTELKELQCYDLKCSEDDSNHLYVASNYGVLHCLTSGMKPKPKVFTTQADTSKSVTCIEMCPFSSSHFLSGSVNGNIRLHSRFYEKCLVNLENFDQNDSLQEQIDIIQWSKNRPCVFYIKDSSNYVHVWDLLSSDMYPIYSIPFREEIMAIRLAPSKDDTYMAMSTKRGNVFVHTINNKFGNRSPEQFTLELKTFLNYVNRL